jgi:parallel beta-helix repeat protein
MRSMQAWCVSVLLLLAVALPAWSTTYYVSPGGNDGVSCGTATNPSTPRQHIVNGAACLSGGDILVVRAGIYDELLNDVLPSGGSGAPTILRAESPGTAILKPSSGWQGQLIDGVAIIMIGSRSWVTIDGLVIDMDNLTKAFGIADRNGAVSDHNSLINLEIKNGHDRGSGETPTGISTQPLNTNGYIAHNHIHHIGDDATRGTDVSPHQAYGMYLGAQSGIIEDNDIHDTGGYCLHMHNNVGTGSSNNIYRNNRFHRCGLTPFGQESVLFAAGGFGNRFYNNLIYDGAKTGLFVGLFGAPSHDNFVYNNTIVNNGEGCIRYGSDNLTIRNNICSANAINAIVQANGSGATVDHNLLDADPRFVNAGAGDFRLSPGSPAIAAGVPMPGLFYSGPAPDLGALESGIGSAPAAGSSTTALPPPRNLTLKVIGK